jgi:hypothetical protein
MFPSSEVFTCPPRIYVDTIIPNQARPNKMTSPTAYAIATR